MHRQHISAVVQGIIKAVILGKYKIHFQVNLISDSTVPDSFTPEM